MCTETLRDNGKYAQKTMEREKASSSLALAFNQDLLVLVSNQYWQNEKKVAHRFQQDKLVIFERTDIFGGQTVRNAYKVLTSHKEG